MWLSSINRLVNKATSNLRACDNFPNSTQIKPSFQQKSNLKQPSLWGNKLTLSIGFREGIVLPFPSAGLHRRPCQ